MKYLYIFMISLLFTGCATSKIGYNSEQNLYVKKLQKQYVENEECVYTAGPFLVSQKLTVENAIKETIKKAKENNFYGNKLVNVELYEGGYTAIFFSKQCLYVKGNLVQDDSIILE